MDVCSTVVGYNGPVKTMILDAGRIDPHMDAAQFLCQFYSLDDCSLSECRRKLYEQEEVLVTEVFNWPADHPAWKEIAASLESVQQHSAWFYVIWGPETTDAEVLVEDRDRHELPERSVLVYDEKKS